MDKIEHICRTMCKAMKIDPDGTGWAISKETEARLGPTYKLWRYQIPVAEAIIAELELD